MTYANDRESTIEEYAEALDIETQQRMARVILDRIDEILGVPAPSADEQATDEEGGKVVSGRPTLTGCDWLREEGVLGELPN